MTFKTTLVALILVGLPSVSFAMCSGYGHKETATMSCADGMVFDSTSGKCVDNASS